MSQQRVDRVAGEVRAVLGEVLAREEIEDPRVRGVGLITVTHVRVSGDLRHARALFTVHDLDGAALERVREGLERASGYFRSAVAKRLRTRVAPEITFEVDHVFESAARVEKLLHEVMPPPPKPAPSDEAGSEDGSEDGSKKGSDTEDDDDGGG